MKPRHKLQEFTFKSGLRSRWYTCQRVAALILSRIPAERRGPFTFSQPLKISAGIWRIDDLPAAK